MWEGRRPASRRARQAPACATDFAPPPPKTATTLVIADCRLRIVDWMNDRRIHNPKSAIRNRSFPGARVESPVHHPRRAPLRRPVIPPLLVRRLGHDRRYLRRHALLVERHVRHVAGIGVPPPTRKHVLGDDLDAHFHRRAAREVDAGIRGQELAHVDRDRKSTRLNSSHSQISYAVFCLKKKNTKKNIISLTQRTYV